MGRVWQLQEAKSRFSEVVDQALALGPQVVSRRGEEVVVVLSLVEYKRMQKSQASLGEFFRQSPLAGVEELDLARDHNLPRTSAEF
ncbi:MAG: type II toxin-antitoxin system prevent-host-death family antitoxin [Caldilineaceae bacterium]